MIRASAVGTGFVAALTAAAACALASAAPPDLTQRRIVTREIATLPAQLEQSLPPAHKTRLVRNDLVLDGVSTPIPLGRSLTDSTDGTVMKSGFDARTLRLAWLEP